MSLAEIKDRGTSKSNFMPTGVSNTIRCADGFKLSVIAGGGSYSVPRHGITVDAQFTHAEVGFPSARPEPWSEWLDYCENPDDPTDTVYGFVPFRLIEALVALHGGEVA